MADALFSSASEARHRAPPGGAKARRPGRRRAGDQAALDGLTASAFGMRARCAYSDSPTVLQALVFARLCPATGATFGRCRSRARGLRSHGGSGFSCAGGVPGACRGCPAANLGSVILARRWRPELPRTPEDLFTYLDGLGIAVSTITHPPLFTVAEARALRGDVRGGHTKNLFLRDRKGAFFLLTVGEDAAVDLKTIHRTIGAAGRVSFGSADMLMRLLGVIPGAVTVFGAINDEERKVSIILDEDLMRHDIINAHPLTNEATTSIRRDDLLRFVESTGHEPVILKASA